MSQRVAVLKGGRSLERQVSLKSGSRVQDALERLGHEGTAIEERLDFPIVVKPAGQGSALGIKFARTPADVPTALVAAFSYDRKVLLERHVTGRDLAVSIIDDDGSPRALPVVEAVPEQEDFYDFESRYEIGRTRFLGPAELAEDAAARAADIALAGWRPGGWLGSLSGGPMRR